ncbi:MAG: hypothetical protein IPN38_15510 [Flavobacteriales bacterium]|nr:hypothetical protein [Flavobacteriales bacterium]
MERPGKEGFFAPLTLTEQVILGIAALFSCGAMVFLFRMYLLYENLIDGTSSDDIDRASAAGSIMQGFAGTILAFASSLLFFVALIMQLREHRQAVDEMRKTTANHGQALQIAREEKEFNVCQAAVLAIVDETKRFKVVLDHTQGFDNIYSTTRSWGSSVTLG